VLDDTDEVNIPEATAINGRQSNTNHNEPEQTCEDGSYDAFARVTCAHVANDGTSMRTSAAIDVPIKHSSGRRAAGALATATGLLDMAVQAADGTTVVPSEPRTDICS
jgi:hypothetical protein